MKGTFPKWPRPRTATHLKSCRLKWNCSSSLEKDQCLHEHPLWVKYRESQQSEQRTGLQQTTGQLTSKAWGFKARGQCFTHVTTPPPLKTCMPCSLQVNRPWKMSRTGNTKTKAMAGCQSDLGFYKCSVWHCRSLTKQHSTGIIHSSLQLTSMHVDLPYLCVFLDGGELQVRMLDLLLHHSVQVWLHRYAVSLVQEVKRGECILRRGNTKQEEGKVSDCDQMRRSF